MPRISTFHYRHSNMTFLLKIVALVLLVQLPLSSTLCPNECNCDGLKTVCSSGGLDIIPHFLNPRITTLRVTNNKVKKLDGALTFYSDLVALDLSQNQFHHLGRQPFIGQHKLQQLNLSHNFISSLGHTSKKRKHQTFKGPTHLQTLDLSKNVLTSISNHTFSDLQNLVELKLSSNKLSRISSNAFLGLSRLRMLHLDNNQLATLSAAWLVPLRSLRFLYVSENRLSTISAHTFKPLMALRVVDLHNNQLASLDESAFKGARSLDTLDLSNNLLEEIPTDSLSKVTKLKQLKLSSNPVMEIKENAFQELYDLEDLQLDQMVSLLGISGHAFVDNIRLSILNLENNPVLDPLPYGIFDSNPLMKSVSFRNNSWTTLAIQQVPTQSLKQLQLEGLPLSCNCSMIWLWQWYQTLNETNLELDNARCTDLSVQLSEDKQQQDLDPNELDLLSKMSPDQLICSELSAQEILVIVASSVLVVVCVLLIVVVIAFCRWKRQKSQSQMGSPCLHIKDDTMVYRGTLKFGDDTYVFPTNGLAATTSPPTYHKPDTEPFYEVPKFTDTDVTATNTASSLSEGDPKSSDSSKYSSSGYIGSELWDPDYFSSLGNTSAATAHCYTNPTSAANYTLSRLHGGFASPHSSSGIGSGGSDSSTVSTKFRPVFFSPQPRHNTMFNRNQQPVIQHHLPRDYQLKYSTGTGLVAFNQGPKKPTRRRPKNHHYSEDPQFDLNRLTTSLTSRQQPQTSLGTSSANLYV